MSSSSSPQRTAQPSSDAAPAPLDRRRWEIGTFFAIVALVIPLLTVLSIATYALVVWIFQMLVFGPPGPIGG